MTTRSDDYFDGLQTAYKLIFAYQQKTGRPEHINACANLLLIIDKEIEKECAKDNEPEKRIILV